MTAKELIDVLSKFDQNANIITFNRTSHRWFKTGAANNYPAKTVEEIYEKCSPYAKKQLDSFNKNDVTFYF